MRRRLVQHGEKTLMVSLPAKWVRLQELKKGDEVVLAPENSFVTISKEERFEAVHKIKISIKLETHLPAHAVLSNAYKLGFDEILVDYSGKEQLECIKQAVKSMIGFEIVNLTVDTCMIKSVIKSTDMEYESIKKRCWFSIKSAFETFISDMKSGKQDNYNVVCELYDNNIKFTDFCRRLINKHVFLDVKNSCLEYSVILKLVSVLALIKEAYFCIMEKKIKPGRDFIDFVEKSYDYFNLVYDAYYEKDFSLGTKVIARWEVLNHLGEKLLKKYGVPVSKFLEIIRYCRNSGGHIIGLYYLDNELKI